MALILDRSRPPNVETRTAELNVIQEVLRRLNLGNNAVRVSISAFNGDAGETLVSLADNNNVDGLVNAVNRVAFNQNPDREFFYVVELVSRTAFAGQRPNVPNVLILVVADELKIDPQNLVTFLQTSLGISSIIVVGIGDRVDRTQLRDISMRPLGSSVEPLYFLSSNEFTSGTRVRVVDDVFRSITESCSTGPVPGPFPPGVVGSQGKICHLLVQRS